MAQVLAGQPVRRAPATLAGRVMGELARRAALPWWRRGFAYWPLGARVALVLALGLLLWLVLATTGSASVGVDAALRSDVAGTLTGWSTALHALGSVAGEIGGLVARIVPSAWAYGIAAAVAALYVSFFGLGAATYKVLQARS
jgi:glucose dehydrogenase